MTKRAKPQTKDVVISDRFWTWMWRFGQGFAVLVGVLWFAFQLYSDVGGLKESAKTVKEDVKLLFTGQEKITKTQEELSTTLGRIELAVQPNKNK